jgi:hypothetical protein
MPDFAWNLLPLQGEGRDGDGAGRYDAHLVTASRLFAFTQSSVLLLIRSTQHPVSFFLFPLSSVPSPLTPPRHVRRGLPAPSTQHAVPSTFFTFLFGYSK